MIWYNLTDLLPTVYREIKSMYAAAETEDVELRNFIAMSKRVFDNFFIQTCDVDTIKYYEDLLGIEAINKDDLEERRAFVLSALNDQKPFTLQYLIEQLDAIFGAGNWSFPDDVEGNPDAPYFDEGNTKMPKRKGRRLMIAVFNALWSQLRQLFYILVRILPCHILPRIEQSNKSVQSVNPNVSCLAGTVARATCTY